MSTFITALLVIIGLVFVFASSDVIEFYLGKTVSEYAGLIGASFLTTAYVKNFILSAETPQQVVEGAIMPIAAIVSTIPTKEDVNTNQPPILQMEDVLEKTTLESVCESGEGSGDKSVMSVEDNIVVMRTDEQCIENTAQENDVVISEAIELPVVDVGVIEPTELIDVSHQPTQNIEENVTNVTNAQSMCNVLETSEEPQLLQEQAEFETTSKVEITTEPVLPISPVEDIDIDDTPLLDVKPATYVDYMTSSDV